MNLTITVDDEVLKRARMRALQEDTSVNAVLRSFLEAYASSAGREEAAIADLIALSVASTASRGSATWTRDDLHER
jgi:plasmid stability protein